MLKFLWRRRNEGPEEKYVYDHRQRLRFRDLKLDAQVPGAFGAARGLLKQHEEVFCRITDERTTHTSKITSAAELNRCLNRHQPLRGKVTKLVAGYNSPRSKD